MFDINSKIIVSDNKLGIKEISIKDLLRIKKEFSVKNNKEDSVTITSINSYILSYHVGYRKIDWDQIIRINIVKSDVPRSNEYWFKGNNDMVISRVFPDNKIFNIDRTKGFVFNFCLASGFDTVIGSDGLYYKVLDYRGIYNINKPEYLISIETKYNRCYFVDGFLFKSE